MSAVSPEELERLQADSATTKEVADRTWDSRFVQMAHVVATWSKDPAKQVGAVLVAPDRRQYSAGYNGFPRGVKDYPSRLESVEQKRVFTVHAELNAILNAAFPTSGCTLYVTQQPCHECAKAIIQAGVARVVARRIADGSSWKASCDVGAAMMLETGAMQVVLYGEASDAAGA